MNSPNPAISPPTLNPVRFFAQIFAKESEILHIKPFGSGHINDTFVASLSNGSRFILQRINHQVFTKVDQLMANIVLASKHLSAHSKNLGYLSVEFIPTPENTFYVGNSEQGYWRAMHFIQNSITFDKAHDPNLAFEAGKALGAFHAMFAHFDASQLHHTLPHFHHLGRRVNSFELALEKAETKRVKSASKLIDFARSHQEQLQCIDHLTDHNLVPLRVVHNDPKLNNVLFNQTGKALGLIDLDTVMPGCLLHDFGDAIRTSASLADEDEPNENLCGINLQLFEAYSRGYGETARQMLTSVEKTNLPVSSIVMTFTIGLRFLTDYLNGDVYYKTHYPTHNLVRAQAQFAQAADMLNKLSVMQAIIKHYF